MQVAAYIGWIGFGLVTSAMLVWVSRRLDRDRAILGGGLVLLGGYQVLRWRRARAHVQRA
ncbi:MAG: hypothetical protein R3228_15820 [Halioglobus sp.]|nr:hypothetical protein [Halioglobus sp.]